MTPRNRTWAVPCALWSPTTTLGARFATLNQPARVLYLYESTCLARNWPGLYRLELDDIWDDVGLIGSVRADAMARLEVAGLARYDHEHALVFVVDAFDVQAQPDGALRNAARCVLEFAESPLAAQFVKRYPAVRAHLAALADDWRARVGVK